MSDYIDYGMTWEQLHAGLDKLWKALLLKRVQDVDVFTLAANKINKLRSDNISLVATFLAIRDLLNQGNNKEAIEIAYTALREHGKDYKNTPIPADAICTFRDGDRMCAIRGDFENLQESPAGFGPDSQDAIADLLHHEECQQFLEFLDHASQVIASWPDWKRGVLESTSHSTRETPR